MFNPSQYQGSNQGGFMKAIGGLSSLMAVILALVFGPFVGTSLEHTVVPIISQSYPSSGWSDFAGGLIWLSGWPIVFFTSNAVLFAVFMNASLWISRRIFNI